MSRIDDVMRLASRERAVESRGPEIEAVRPPDDPVPTDWLDGATAEPPSVTRPAAAPGPGPAVSESPTATAPPATAPSSSGPLALFRGFNPNVLERLVAGSPNPVLTEQYRQLAATLHHTQMAQQIKVVMVASAIASEGKTLTATNLALTLSESYRRRVLLIDADLRRPSLHDVFQVPNISGLNEGLQSPTERKLSLMQITNTLTLLPAGRPNPDPMSSLTSPRMRQILAEAAACFEWVIVDTPPVAILADANLLSSMVDTSILVVRAGHTPLNLVEKTIDALGRDRILGVVLNAAEQKQIHSDYYSYRSYGSGA